MQFSTRRIADRMAMAFCAVATILSAFFLFYIIGYLFIGALPSLNIGFLLAPESSTGVYDGAIGNAIAGTLLISILATIIATPLALGTAVYLARYAPENRYTRIFRFFLEVLSGTPSIVIGVFGFLVLVAYLKPFTGGYSLIAGAIGLAILIVPVIERGAEDAITVIDAELEEGSYALGATKWQTIRDITLPAAVSGIGTAIILGFGRAAEESAVVLFTAGYSQYMPEFTVKAHQSMFLGMKIYPLQDLVGTLPISVYDAYVHTGLVPVSNAFAAAFVLVCIVLAINLTAKFIFSRFIGGAQGPGRRSEGIIAGIAACLNTSGSIESQPEPITPAGLPADLSALGDNLLQQRPMTPAWRETIRRYLPSVKRTQTYQKPETGLPADPSRGGKSPTPHPSIDRLRPFFRTFLPFAIPALLLLIVAFLATVPPLHHVLGPASPSLAGLFATGLAGIVTVAGLIFGLVLAKKGGAFRTKNRRSGMAAVAGGFCILCIAGVLCSSAATGLFMTGTESPPAPAKDRSAQLAELISQMGDGENTVSTPAGGSTAVAKEPDIPALAAGTSKGVPVPVKDALSLGESYRYGDSTRICDATVYDYKILPFYFWWFIDYNRFVEQDPQPGNEYLVVFIRIEDIGMKSAILPSADQIQITNNGNTYTHLPFFNKSALSSYQTDFYRSHYDQLPYQWIRELGQEKRDYAFLTGYNIFGDWTFTTTNTTETVTPTTTDNTSTTSTTSTNSTTNGKGFFIKPGRSNAIDGFLIYEVPESLVKDGLNQTYVDISFNANSGTRWQLK